MPHFWNGKCNLLKANKIFFFSKICLNSPPLPHFIQTRPTAVQIQNICCRTSWKTTQLICFHYLRKILSSPFTNKWLPIGILYRMEKNIVETHRYNKIIRKSWKYPRGNQKSLIKERQIIVGKRKRTNNGYRKHYTEN